MGIKQIFGENLKYYRKQKKLSQEELAECIEISPKHLSALERGLTFVSAELLEKLCLYLGVSASVLFYTAKEKSADDSVLSTVDRVVEEELRRATDSIKVNIRRSPHCAKSPGSTKKQYHTLLCPLDFPRNICYKYSSCIQINVS
jgi:transcriptional regulator with XRE-family HTH domain